MFQKYTINEHLINSFDLEFGRAPGCWAAGPTTSGIDSGLRIGPHTAPNVRLPRTCHFCACRARRGNSQRPAKSSPYAGASAGTEFARLRKRHVWRVLGATNRSTSHANNHATTSHGLDRCAGLTNYANSDSRLIDYYLCYYLC